MTADRQVVRQIIGTACTRMALPATAGGTSYSDAIEIEQDGILSLMVVRRKVGGFELASLGTEYKGPRMENVPDEMKVLDLGRGPQGDQFWIVEPLAITLGRFETLLPSWLLACNKGTMCVAARGIPTVPAVRPGVIYRDAFTAPGISDNWFPLYEESATGDWLYAPIVVGSGPAIILEPKDVELSLNLPARPVWAQMTPVLRASMKVDRDGKIVEVSPIRANRRDGSAVFPLHRMPIRAAWLKFGPGTDQSLSFDAQVVAYGERVAAGSKIEITEVTYVERKKSGESYSAVGFIGIAQGDLVLKIPGGESKVIHDGKPVSILYGRIQRPLD